MPFKDKEKKKIWMKKYRREWYLEHKEESRLRHQKYQKENREKIYETAKKWKQKNRLRIIVYEQNRRSLMKDLTLKTIQLVYEDNIKKYGTLTCYLCKQSILFGNDCLEHKMPLSRNGSNNYNNLEVACRECNTSKSNKTLEEYLINKGVN